MDRRLRILAAAIGSAVAVLVAMLFAPVAAELLSWDSSPALRQGQAVMWFWIAFPVAAVASLLGTWLGIRIVPDGRPFPGWRAGKWGAAVGIVLGVVLLPLGVLAIVLTPVAMVAAGSSGGLTAALLSRGTHGKT